MTYPTTSSDASTVANSKNNNIDALLSGKKWGLEAPNASDPLTISYSFPWINGLSAVFSAPLGAQYSSDGEPNATQHFGLNKTQQAAATSALTAWSNVANVNFQLLTETNVNVGDIRFAFSSAPSLTQWWGYARYPDSFWPYAGDIWINAKIGSQADWAVGSFNHAALMHEIGHALGLKHPFSGEVIIDENLDSINNTIMSYDIENNLYKELKYVNGKYEWISNYIYPETPMVFDIAAIQYIYGANNNYNTGNNEYNFDPAKPFYKTIWDAGGKDAISVSNFLAPCIIDLTPGNYSSIRYISPSNSGGANSTYDGAGNLGIAFGCIIENAIGGFGDDTIIGNSIGNYLDGGNGHDVMYGKDGNDIFDWDSKKRDGDDKFYGGMGNDQFVLNSVKDIVIEYVDEGLDSIWIDFSYSISTLPNIENLFGYGPNNLTLIGNSKDNYFRCSTGNDQLVGGLGTDTVIYAGSIQQYALRINRAAKTATVTDNVAGRDGTDSLTGVEKLLFGNIAFDLFNPARTETPKHSITNGFLFDPSYYLLSHPELASTLNLQTAFGHYLSSGSADGYKPNTWFDPVFYANRWSDLRGANLDAATLFQHYNLYGVWEGRSASSVYDQYDGARYLRDNPDVAAYVDGNLATFLGSRTNGAIAHYIIYGADEGRFAFTTTGTQVEPAVIIGAVTS